MKPNRAAPVVPSGHPLEDASPATRHAIGSETELRVEQLPNGRGSIRLFRRSPADLSTAPDAYTPTGAGVLIPAHLLLAIAADLVALADAMHPPDDAA